jgi:quinol monooxygenase YgiN
MATILAHIRVHEGRERDFEAAARALFDATHAAEAGVRQYEYWRGAEPGLYHCLLAFDDFHAFLAHQTSDHHERAAPQLAALIRDMELEWVDPVPGASRLPPTRMQDLPGGADELTARYHQLFAARVQTWWEALRAADDGAGS